MDKKTVIGIVLIIAITLMMPFYQKWITGDKVIEQQKKQSKNLENQKLETLIDTLDEEIEIKSPPPQMLTEDTLKDKTDSKLKLQEADAEKNVEIENDVIRVVLSSKGGGNPILWELKKYDHFSGGSVNLINDNSLNFKFLNVNGKEINLDNYNFNIDINDGKKIFIDVNKNECKLIYYLPIHDGKIVKTLTFYKEKYSYDISIKFENLSNYIINRKYFVFWNNGLPTTEKNINDDNSYARAFAYMAEELEKMDASDENYLEDDFNGRVDWAAIRTKYFLTAVVPFNSSKTDGVTLGEKR